MKLCENPENSTLFILKVKETSSKTTYYKKYLVGSMFDEWLDITYVGFMSSVNINHRVTHREVFNKGEGVTETIYHVTYFKPESDY